MYNDDILLMESPQSTENLIYQHLQSDFGARYTESIESYSTDEEYPVLTDKSPSAIEQEIAVEISSFSELQAALEQIESINPYLCHPQRYTMDRSYITTEEDFAHLSCTCYTIPRSVHADIENSGFMDVLMAQAEQHWCCIGFKVAPVSINLIKDWRGAPPAIIYCIASISLVSLINQHVSTQSPFAKEASMVFYEQARKKMEDVFLDDMKPQIIQSYFCLSYTSNLLRLYDQQRTWGGLASISLQHLAKRDMQQMDRVGLECWLRWYYIDAWMCLTLNRDCLLPHHVPWLEPQKIQAMSVSPPEHDKQHNLYGFACLTGYMRRYIQSFHSGRIFGAQKTPSAHYYEITQGLVDWYGRLSDYRTCSSRLHLHICYHSMRLVVLYQFLQPQQPPPRDILIDCLETNLELLQALQHLKETGCDQSTYHHMFFAIHNTAKCIYQYNLRPFKAVAEESLKINFLFLKSTQAYLYDVFKMRFYAEKIKEQFKGMNISKIQPKLYSQIHVFKQDASAIIKRNNKKRKEE